MSRAEREATFARLFAVAVAAEALVERLDESIDRLGDPVEYECRQRLKLALGELNGE